MHFVGKTLITMLWIVFWASWLVFGMGPPAMALVGYLSGDNVTGASLFLMALYAVGMVLLLIATLAWAHHKPAN